jgi:hypothetical protein
MHLIGASAKKGKFAYCSYVPVVIRLVNQRWLGKHGLQAQFIANKPGDTTAGRDNRILKLAPAETDRGEDLVFL